MSTSSSKLKFSKKYLNYNQRQLILAEIGKAGQEQLFKTKVLVVGLGGLGIPALQYLSGSGVGQIGIVDNDLIDISNLSRQQLYNFEDIGQLKTEVIKKKLLLLNPLIKITSFPFIINPNNAVECIGNFDIIIDATDNFVAKFLLHDVCFLLKKKLVQAGLYQYEGILRSFDFSKTITPPCLRCLWEIRPIDGCTSNCNVAGIIPATAGIIGCYQAMETIKLILEWRIKEDISYEYIIELKEFSINKTSWGKNKKCILCSKKNYENIDLTLKSLFNYDIKNSYIQKNIQVPSLTIEDIEEINKHNLKKIIFVDTREKWEIENKPFALILKKSNGQEKIINKETFDKYYSKNIKNESLVYIGVCQSGYRSQYWVKEQIQKDKFNSHKYISLKNGINRLSNY